MDETRSMRVEIRNAYRIWVGNSKEGTAWATLKYRTGLDWLRTGSNNGLLCTR